MRTDCDVVGDTAQVPRPQTEPVVAAGNKSSSISSIAHTASTPSLSSAQHSSSSSSPLALTPTANAIDEPPTLLLQDPLPPLEGTEEKRAHPPGFRASRCVENEDGQRRTVERQEGHAFRTLLQMVGASQNRIARRKLKLLETQRLEHERLEERERFSKLPPFASIPFCDIITISNGNSEAALEALATIQSAVVVGFDTESHMEERVGGTPLVVGLDLVQVSTRTAVFLFRVNPSTWPIIKCVSTSDEILKIGFDLRRDFELMAQYNLTVYCNDVFGYGWSAVNKEFVALTPTNFFDLAYGSGKQMCFEAYCTKTMKIVADEAASKTAALGCKSISPSPMPSTHWAHKNTLGLERALSMVCNVSFQKDAKTTRSDWSKDEMSREQVVYAAADAYGAFCVYEALVSKGIDYSSKKHSPTKTQN